nr:hypothetical protein [Tanacetum cinerariifolium]
MPAVKPKVLAPGMYVIDVEPIPPHNRNNREVHLDYLKHLKESVATLREIVEDARKHDEIEPKKVLIANDNLVADCLSKDVFYTATDYVLTVSRFSGIHEALISAQKRIAELESDNSNL